MKTGTLAVTVAHGARGGRRRLYWGVPQVALLGGLVTPDRYVEITTVVDDVALALRTHARPVEPCPGTPVGANSVLVAVTVSPFVAGSNGVHR